MKPRPTARSGDHPVRRGLAYLDYVHRAEPASSSAATPLDELMGRVASPTPSTCCCMGELPTPAIGRMHHGDARLVDRPRRDAAVDAGGAQRRDDRRAAEGRRGGRRAGVRVRITAGTSRPACDSSTAGSTLVRGGTPYKEAAESIVHGMLGEGRRGPDSATGFHSRDPRANDAASDGLELELEGEHVRLLRVMERALGAAKRTEADPIPINVDGAIAAICGDLGLDHEFGAAPVHHLARARADRARARGTAAGTADASD